MHQYGVAAHTWGNHVEATNAGKCQEISTLHLNEESTTLIRNAYAADFELLAKLAKPSLKVASVARLVAGPVTGKGE